MVSRAWARARICGGIGRVKLVSFLYVVVGIDKEISRTAFITFGNGDRVVWDVVHGGFNERVGMI